MKKNCLLALGILAAVRSAGAAQGYADFKDFSVGEVLKGGVEVPSAEAGYPRRPGQTSLDALAALLSDPAVFRDQKAAALMALKSDELGELNSWSGSFEPTAEKVMADSLRDISDAGFEPDVRSRAVRVWGAFGRWFRYSGAIHLTVETLSDYARNNNPMDSRRGLRLPAMLGLSLIAERIPPIETQASERLLASGFDTLRNGYEPQERMMGMRLFYNYFRGHGTGVLESSPMLMQRLRSELLEPLRHIDSLYADRRLNDVNYRGFLYGTLHRLAHSWTSDSRLRFDCQQILKNAHESRLETEPQLRQLLALYATGRLPLYN